MDNLMPLAAAVIGAIAGSLFTAWLTSRREKETRRLAELERQRVLISQFFQRVSEILAEWNRTTEKTHIKGNLHLMEPEIGVIQSRDVPDLETFRFALLTASRNIRSAVRPLRLGVSDPAVMKVIKVLDTWSSSYASSAEIQDYEKSEDQFGSYVTTGTDELRLLVTPPGETHLAFLLESLQTTALEYLAPSERVIGLYVP